MRMSTRSEAMPVAKSQQVNASGTKKNSDLPVTADVPVSLSGVNTERSTYCCDQPSYVSSVSVPAQHCPMEPCHSPARAGREAWEPVSADAQARMGNQVGINWETRATLPVLSCFCLCKEEEMFVKPISQNELSLRAGGPAEPPAGSFCLHTRRAGSPVGPLLSAIPLEEAHRQF